MNRIEIMLTIILPCLLGVAIFVPRPGADNTVAANDSAKPEKVYAWGCGGADAHTAPILVSSRPAEDTSVRTP